MKLTPGAQKLLDLIREAGGSICPGSDFQASHDINRLLRNLERKGLLKVEQTDDGYRYTVREGDDGSA